MTMDDHNRQSTTDFRYLDVHYPTHRIEIEHGLLEMGTKPEVIGWFFSQVDDLKAEYTNEIQIHKQIDT